MKLVPDLDSGTLVLLVLVAVLAFAHPSTELSTSLVAIAMIVANYKWGSSQGSRSKDAVIAAIVPPAVTTPVVTTQTDTTKQVSL